MNAAARSDTPVAEGERLVAIDTLRGVAVLGILVMNIYVFAKSSSAYMNPLAMGGTEWHNIATCSTRSSLRFFRSCLALDSP